MIGFQTSPVSLENLPRDAPPAPSPPPKMERLTFLRRVLVSLRECEQGPDIAKFHYQVLSGKGLIEGGLFLPDFEGIVVFWLPGFVDALPISLPTFQERIVAFFVASFCDSLRECEHVPDVAKIYCQLFPQGRTFQEGIMTFLLPGFLTSFANVTNCREGAGSPEGNGGRFVAR